MKLTRAWALMTAAVCPIAASADQAFSLQSTGCGLLLAIEDSPSALQPEFVAYLVGVVAGAAARATDPDHAGLALRNYCRDFPGMSLAVAVTVALANDEQVAFYAARTDEVRRTEALEAIQAAEASGESDN